MTTLLHSAHRIDELGEVPDAWLLFDGPVIAAAGSGLHTAPTADERVDLAGARLVPGFIDLHGHGGGGHAYDDGGTALTAALAAHREHGTTRSVVSLVANPLGQLRDSLAEIAALVATDPLVLGSHLEGPFLAPDRRGAHSADFLRLPDPEAVESLLAAAAGTLRQVTIAPELPGALQAIDEIVEAGVVVAIGHTEADFDTTRAAFARGARMLTHAFNAMPGIHHRAPGPVLAAFADDRISIELILDGQHVHPEVARLAFDAAPGRVALITDAMAAAAAADGDYRLGSLNVTVHEGFAKLSGTSTIAGSTLTQDVALRLAIDEVGLPPATAVAALTAVPARALGLGHRFGLLKPGYAADAVALDAAGRVTRVWADGRALLG
ncbi:N-acetylglucosamine-6-phosphate deacetylase [Lysinimonas soli]|uniref:N-acetylglucosamine-6-phosphate deacetylase n=1 Tax=Lysinimonas soli TaxID=1074233 RepID=A0ABW0NSS7_9MICO